MSSIPEDSVLRRHYLASVARRQAAGGSPSPSRPADPPPASRPATTQSGGILGFIRRLFGG